MHARVLAIDLRSQLFGFAIFEGPRTLLGSGRRILNIKAQDGAALVSKKIDRLVRFFAPSVIVLKHTSGRKDQELLNRKDAIEVIKREAELRSVKFVLLKRKEIYQAFQQSGNTSKYKIAQRIAERLPEVEWKLPSNRRLWEPEHHNMAIFDAISVGLAYFVIFEHVIEAGEGKIRTEK